MKTPTSHDIALRAYNIWETRGHPWDYESSVDCWLAAEKALTESEQEEGDAATGPAEEDSGGAELDLKSGPDITNLDRALTPSERSRVRDERRNSEGSRRGEDSTQGDVDTASAIEHFIVTADRAKLRIYHDGAAAGGSDQALRVASTFDLPEGKQGYTDRDSDRAGRFPGPRGKGSALGGSIDERLPMLEEQQRRAASELGSRVNAFFLEHPRATWDFAAGPVIHRALLDVLDADVRERLGEALVKELANQPLPELRRHFQQAGEAGERR